MYIIESIKLKQNFVSAILKTLKDTEIVFEKIIQKKNFKIIKHEELKFPFFIIEKKNKFEYLQSKNDVFERIKSINVIDSQDECDDYFTVYFIDKEYNTGNPELDSMGTLDEDHIGNFRVKQILKKGKY